MRLVVPLLLLAGAVTSSAQMRPERVLRPSFPPDIISNDILHVEMDNETTRVMRIKLDAGSQLGALGERAGVLVCFTDCNLKLGSQEVHLRAGETKWIAESRRVTTNLGAQAQMLYIESKAARR